jgi:amino acid permease
VFAFTCHQNVSDASILQLWILVPTDIVAIQIFSVYNEQKDNSQKKINQVIGTSIGVAIVLYEGIAVMGYLSFGKAVMGNIILECKYKYTNAMPIPCNFTLTTWNVL